LRDTVAIEGKFYHNVSETDSVSETLCSFVFLEYQRMDEVQKPNNPESIHWAMKMHFCWVFSYFYLKIHNFKKMARKNMQQKG
jgi:hypothetical protein